ncbi:hypothetical protein ElyMa_003370800 [Elysia marginata]|uniref:Uncharacterized protein n=1 Tax=Elysia marginata TaxID=1093978 RepID=A0AAV4JKT0_9GAST|nr:hypothetical protein ElyMa_003370800 [Elysia marginata]
MAVHCIEGWNSLGSHAAKAMPYGNFLKKKRNMENHTEPWKITCVQDIVTMIKSPKVGNHDSPFLSTLIFPFDVSICTAVGPLLDVVSPAPCRASSTSSALNSDLQR